ncbi:dUTP diphosphatase [Candidatus Pacearchaeota archaeon]|nr:dUTP diphosphatase [Candidatus Pacearchaeota archaeon]
MPVKIKKLHADAKIPLVGSEHAAGFDLYSCEDYELQVGETHAVATGIAIEVPVGKVLFIWDRSGMGFKGIHRFAGVIDSDYRGELKIVLCNHSKNPYKIIKGDRIAQGVIQDYYIPEFEEVEELSSTDRGIGGFGSTGK